MRDEDYEKLPTCPYCYTKHVDVWRDCSVMRDIQRVSGYIIAEDEWMSLPEGVRHLLIHIIKKIEEHLV